MRWLRDRLWIAWTFTFFLNWVGFLWIGFRARRPRWVFYGVIYAVPLIVFIVASAAGGGDDGNSRAQNVGVALLLLGSILSIVHAALLAGPYARRAESHVDAEPEPIPQRSENELRRFWRLTWWVKAPIAAIVALAAVLAIVSAVSEGSTGGSGGARAGEAPIQPTGALTDPSPSRRSASAAAASTTAAAPQRTAPPAAATATPTVQAPTFTPSATPTSTSTPSPSPTLPPPPTPTPIPPTFEQQVEKSYRDNSGFVSGASTRGLTITWTASTGTPADRHSSGRFCLRICRGRCRYSGGRQRHRCEQGSLDDLSRRSDHHRGRERSVHGSIRQYEL